MSSAASKAAKSMGSSKRNRPALAMSQKSTDEPSSTPQFEGGSTPLFMDDVNSQYQSLSERLAKENAGSSAPSSGASGTGRKQKVKWAETAALASTLDAAKASDTDDGDAPRSSPLEAISDLFQKKYTMPVFLLATTGIFLMVHLTGRQDGGSKLFANKVELTHDGQDTVFTASTSGQSPLSALEKERSSPLLGLHKTRSFNVGQGDGFSSVLFSFVPTPSPGVDETPPPTEEVMLHTTPKLTRASIPTPATAGKDGFEPGWILVPTSSNGKGKGLEGGQAGFKEGWGYPPGVPTPDPALLGAKGNMGGLDGGLEVAPNKWGFPPGYPTPNPALLANVSPQTQKWNFPDGVPTPDPAYLPKGEDDGSKTGLLWGYPPGVPTPNPDLLVEVAPDNTSPTTLKWNIPLGQPTPDPAYLGLIDNGSPTTLKWNIPDGQPTPDPALLTEVAPDKGKPTTLKWNIPLGQPTPDPALLGKPTTLGWGYPPGVPTPDPALLQGVPETVTWGYPPGVPTPDPALLGGVVQTMSWGYPPGVPTPNPDLLLGETQAPSGRAVETGKFDSKDKDEVEVTPSKAKGKEEKITICHRTSSAKNPFVEITISLNAWPAHQAHGDTQGACPKKATFTTPEAPEEEEVQVLKMPGIPETPPEEPPLVVVEPAITPQDSSGNVIEIAQPPAPVPQISVTVKNPPIPQPPPPDVQVITQPASGSYGWFRPLGSTGSRPARPGGPRPPGPGRVQGQGGYNIPNQGYIMSGGCGGCGCGCCGCGGGMMGGGMMWGSTGVVPAQDGSNNFVVPQFMMPAGMSADPRSGFTGLGVEGLPQPQCPWDCIIDETVPTKGRSNEDDAIYEIFYTNPLNCCGTIVEIGAGNGEEHSPSYFFEHGMNWTAILTEADPINFDAITKTRTGDKAMLLNGAFCQEGADIYFDNESRFFQTEKSGQYSSEVLSQTPFPITDQTPKVQCIRLDSDVLSGVDHVDVMVIRVKGDPWAVVRTMDWDITVDIWVILMEDRPGMLHDTLRAALKLHDYVPAAWEIKLWCETPENCMQNEVWLRKSFSALPQPLMGMTGDGGLRGSIA